MTQNGTLGIILGVWDEEKRAWPVPIPRSQRFSVSSLKVQDIYIPQEQWELNQTAKGSVLRWKSNIPPPVNPVAAVAFQEKTTTETVWNVAGRVNKLTGLLVLIGTLATAYFAYLSETSKKQNDILSHQLESWRDDLKPLQCSQEVDPQRAVSDCISSYLNDKKELDKTRRLLSAKCP